MRVLHAIWSLGLAGAERYCASLASLQAARGDTVSVLIRPQGGQEGIQTWLDDRVHVIEAAQDERVQLARRALARVRPDIVHTHLETANCLFGSLDVDTPLVSTLHVGFEPGQFEHHHGLICLTEAQRVALATRGCDKALTTVGGWTPPAPALDVARVEALRQQLGIAPTQLLFAAIGRLHHRKGGADLIRTFRRFSAPEARLLMIGEGPQHEEIAGLVERDPRVILLPPRSDLALYYGAIDVFVSPSWRETFGLVVLEAMAAGCPIISTATEGPAAYLPPDCLIPVQDEAAMLAALQAAPRDRRRITYAMHDFDPAAAVAQIRRFYRRLCAPADGPCTSD